MPTKWGLAVAVGCAYEIVALFSKRIPTITELMYGARRHHILRFAFWLGAGAALNHFYDETPAFGRYMKAVAGDLSSPTA
jgi:hypothetical protein